MKSSVAICAMVRNESGGIDEWINHYLVRGVSHFFIIDDDSDDGCYEILKKHESAGYLTLLTPKMPRVVGRQTRGYNEFIKPLIGDFDWVAILDADEFLWDSGGFLLPDYFSDVSPEISMVNVPMIDFGDSGLISQPENIVSSFIRRAPDGKNFRNDQLKSICRTSHLLSIEVHVSSVSGSSIIDRDRLKLNHYKLQSRERWDNVVVPRGGAEPLPWMRHSKHYFTYRRRAINAVADFGLINQNKQML